MDSYVLSTIISCSIARKIFPGTHIGYSTSRISQFFCTIKKYSGNNGFPQVKPLRLPFFFFLENFYFYSKSSSALNPPSLPTYILSTLRKNAFHPWFRTALLLRLICTYINLKHLGCESGFRSVSFDQSLINLCMCNWCVTVCVYITFAVSVSLPTCICYLYGIINVVYGHI